MLARHVAAPGPIARVRRPRVRWLVGTAGGAALAATVIAMTSGSAAAADRPVRATFGVTGVATSNCPDSVGGTDVYVKPGQELDVKSSIVGLTLRGAPLDSSRLASLDGALVINPHSRHPIRLNITNRIQKVTGLTAGNHKWIWTVRTVKVGLLKVPLGLSAGAVKAGAKLSWNGTIHVTRKAAHCGLAVQLPRASASVSAPGLPRVRVGLPGVKVSAPVNVPTARPTIGKPGGAHHSSSRLPAGDNPVPVPAKVVPSGDSAGMVGNPVDVNGGPAGSAGGHSGPIAGGAGPTDGSSAPAAAHSPNQDSVGKRRAIDLAASQSAPAGEAWVVLAIVAVIALAFVAATYARLYLRKRGP